MEVTCWICRETYDELHPEQVGFSGNRTCLGCRRWPSSAAPVYHWTTTENAALILRYGLRANSFVCREIGQYKGEVCLEISGVDVDWEHRDPDATWQATVKEHISPNRIRVAE